MGSNCIPGAMSEDEYHRYLAHSGPTVASGDGEGGSDAQIPMAFPDHLKTDHLENVARAVYGQPDGEMADRWRWKAQFAIDVMSEVM